MDEPPPLPVQTPPPSQEPAPSSSLPARLLNVFAVPGEVFDEVTATRATTSNWLVPALVLAVLGALAAMIIFSQPAIQQQIREQQAKAMDKQVQSGKMTREQADRALDMIDKFMGPTMMKLTGAIGGLIAGITRVVWWAFIMWLLAKLFLKVPIKYSKAMEVAGLTMMISALGLVVGLLLQVNLGKLFAGPSLALTITDFDIKRKSHLFAAAANVFYIWTALIMSVGLSRLARVPFLRAALLVCGYWVVQESVLIMIGLGQLAM